MDTDEISSYTKSLYPRDIIVYALTMHVYFNVSESTCGAADVETSIAHSILCSM